MRYLTIEDRNFGWTAERFSELKAQIQAGDATSFRAALQPHLKECALYAMNLAKRWLKKDYLDLNDKHLVQDAFHDALARFEQRMAVETEDSMALKGVRYGSLRDWFVGNAFSRFQGLYEKEQKETSHFVSMEVVPIDAISEEKEEDSLVYLIAKVLDRMPDNAKYFYRRTLKMLYWQGYEVREIAEKIEVGYDNLRQELSTKIRPLFKAELNQLVTELNIDLTKYRIPVK
jgi:DNA-directed RNA polymerase specialized sigma24 family protein